MLFIYRGSMNRMTILRLFYMLKMVFVSLGKFKVGVTAKT